MSKNATGPQVDQNRGDEYGRISQAQSDGTAQVHQVATLKAELKRLASEFDLPDITTWKQGEFIDKPSYNRMGKEWKLEQELRERTLVRPGGGTNNALFQVSGSGRDDDIVAYITAVARAITEVTT